MQAAYCGREIARAWGIGHNIPQLAGTLPPGTTLPPLSPFSCLYQCYPLLLLLFAVIITIHHSFNNSIAHS